MTLAGRISALITAIGLDINALFLRVLPPGGTTGQVLGKSSNSNYSVGWVTPGSGGAVTLKNITVNVPSSNIGSEILINVIDVDVILSSKILIQHGQYLPTDQNDSAIEDIVAISTNPDTGSFSLKIFTRAPIVGPFKFTYLLS